MAAIFKGPNIGRIFKYTLGIKSITRPMNRVNCNFAVQSNPGLLKDGRGGTRNPYRLQSAINRANLRGLSTTERWTDLVNEYFVYAEEEEGHKEEEGGETEPPKPEDDPPDPVEDEDEPLIITDPVEKILQDEWDKC